MIEEEHGGTVVTVTDLKISASEKVSTGEYENYNPHATMEAQVISTRSWPEQRAKVMGSILGMHKDLQEVLEQACGNKIAVEEHEQWDWDTSEDPK